MLRLESVFYRLLTSAKNKRDSENKRVLDEQEFFSQENKEIQQRIRSLTETQKNQLAQKSFLSATSLLSELRKESSHMQTVRRLQSEHQQITEQLLQLQKDLAALERWEISLITPLQRLLLLIEPKKVKRDGDFSPISYEELQEHITTKGGMYLSDFVEIVLKQVESRLATEEYQKYFARLESIKKDFLETGELQLTEAEEASLLASEQDLEIETYLSFIGQSETEQSWKEDFLRLVDEVSKALDFIPAEEILAAFPDFPFSPEVTKATSNATDEIDETDEVNETVEMFMAWDIASDEIQDLAETDLETFILEGENNIAAVARNLLLDSIFTQKFGDKNYQAVLNYLQFPDSFFKDVILQNQQNDESDNSREYLSILLEKYSQSDLSLQQETINFIYSIDDDFCKILACMLSVPEYRDFLVAELRASEEVEKEWTSEKMYEKFQEYASASNNTIQMLDLDSIFEHILRLKQQYNHFPKIENVLRRLARFGTSSHGKVFSNDTKSTMTFKPNDLNFRILLEKTVVLNEQNAPLIRWIATTSSTTQHLSSTHASGSRLRKHRKTR